MHRRRSRYKPRRFAQYPWIRDASMLVRLMLPTDVDAGERLVLYCLASHVNQQGFCWPSRETIARETSMTERGVIRILKRLEQKHIIYRTRWGGERPHSTARYEWPSYSSTGKMHPIYVESRAPESNPVMRLATKIETQFERIKARRRSLGAKMLRRLREEMLDIRIRAGLESPVAM
jgi:hypothetical protein